MPGEAGTRRWIRSATALGLVASASRFLLDTLIARRARRQPLELEEPYRTAAAGPAMLDLDSRFGRINDLTRELRNPLATRKPARRAESGPEAARIEAPGRRRVLVVDDNRDAAESLATLLGLIGNDTRVAFEGEAAIEAAAAFGPDVILLDIGMPGVNGYETCRRIRRQPWAPEVVIIALTGWGQESDRRASREAGFDGHLVKPVAPEQLMTLLAALAPASARDFASSRAAASSRRDAPRREKASDPQSGG